MEGWIQLHRKLTEWEWYKDVNTFKVFMHLILCANHKDANWRGQQLKRGQLIRSLNSLSHETGLSVKQVRTAINKLKKTQEVASEGTSKNTVFSVLRYDFYQSTESRGKQRGKRRASKGQAKGKQGATDNNDNNEDKEKMEEQLLSIAKEINSHYPSTKISVEGKRVNLSPKSKANLEWTIERLKSGDETKESLIAKIESYKSSKGEAYYEMFKNWKENTYEPGQLQQQPEQPKQSDYQLQLLRDGGVKFG